MLNERNLDDRTYEGLMAEAFTQIPLYSEEWTNFNPSDPGITILENLTAFQILQQNHINRVTPAVLQKLLKLVGFEEKKGRCARVLLAAENLEEPLYLSANQRLMLGALCFETNRAFKLPGCRLTGVYSVRDGQVYDCSHLLEREVRVPALVFGKNPQTGDSLWITMDSLPEPEEEIIFHMTAADRHNRNPFAGRGNNDFAEIVWECYTENGFQEMSARDFTGCFLVSGEIRLRLPGQAAAPCPQAPGGAYAIRATLRRAEYDVKPTLVSIDGFLFEAWQKESKAVCYTFNRTKNISLSGALMDEGYVTVFCKEEKGSSYKKYMPASQYEGYVDETERGRLYIRERLADGLWLYSFDKGRFGYGPEKIKNAVKIVAYSEETMRRYFLGTVLGSDNQEIKLPEGHIVADSFCIIARRLDDKGEEIYDFVRPGRYGEEDLSYGLYEDEGRIVIEDAGAYIGADLYIGNLSVTAGTDGNIRAGNRLVGEGLPSSVSFYNPGPGTGGCFRESLEETRRRFLLDLKTHYTAVTALDYEKVAMETPGLCIHKVRAFMNKSRNAVRIAVKPETDEEFPELSHIYRRAVEKQLEEKRLLTTKIEVVAPVYASIDVYGTVSVKTQYENGMELVEEAIRRSVDYIHSQRRFGERLKFNEVFYEIEALDCVEFVYDLSLRPHNPGLARLEDADIVPNENCLCYAGNIVLQKF